MISGVSEHVRDGATAAINKIMLKVKMLTAMSDSLHMEAVRIIPTSAEIKSESKVIVDIRERMSTIMGSTHDLCNYTYDKINYTGRLLNRALGAACDTMEDVHILAEHIDTKSENKSLRAGAYELSGHMRDDGEQLTAMIYACGQHIDNAKLFADHIDTYHLQMISIVSALRNAVAVIETPRFDTIDTSVEICTKKQHATVSEIRVLCMAISKFETSEDEQIYVMLANNTAPALINMIDMCADHHVRILTIVLNDIKAMLLHIRYAPHTN